MNLSYGFIETKGFIAAIEAADAMLKAAKVELIKWQKPGGALVVVVVQGELGACQAAVNAGSVAASRVGELISTHVIPRPFDDTELLVNEFLGGRKQKRKAKHSQNITAKSKSKPLTKKTVKTETEKVLGFLTGKSAGSTLNEISAMLKKPSAAVRILLKELMDSGDIEKIKQLYFRIHKRGRQ